MHNQGRSGEKKAKGKHTKEGKRTEFGLKTIAKESEKPTVRKVGSGTTRERRATTIRNGALKSSLVKEDV
jgi:hypothetical protein